MTTGAGADVAIEVRGLTKTFGERTAFRDVSFDVSRGEVFGFLGPNGAGKTTTVRTLGTLIVPSAGTARVAGVELSEGHGVAIRRRIAVMPESPGLYRRLSVGENLEFFAGLYELDDVAGRVVAALDSVNLAERIDDPCGGLSKGLSQRVGLARALLSDPDVLFLDEPTSGLDPVAVRDFHEIIASLRGRGVTIFLTTHRLDEAEKLCDRVAILNTTLRTIGTPSELRTSLFQPSLTCETARPLPSPAELFSSVPGCGPWRGDGPSRYVVDVADARAAAPALTRALVAAGADVVALYELRHSLEDVYLELVGGAETGAP